MVSSLLPSCAFHFTALAYFFSSFRHIGSAIKDFQFKATRIDASQIYENVKDKIQEGATVYIATDERDKKFFEPLRNHFNVFFLDDFQAELEGVNKNYYGMIDQLVASRGRLFFGCWHSTCVLVFRGMHAIDY